MNAIVESRCGKLRGRFNNGVSAFKGVPFAAPPFGANRLRPPQPVEPWEGVRDAFEFGPKSPEAAYPPGIADALAELVGPGEDCLTLNVWTPEIGAAGRPVMVWIPGGMFEFHATGASAFYDGGRFARDGVVCVTLGYRVGAEGFLYLGDGLANLGLLDQIAALKWVQENIAAFGGDPGQVTIFGESAGGMSAASLLTMPLARGLFRRAHRPEREHPETSLRQRPRSALAGGSPSFWASMPPGRRLPQPRPSGCSRLRRYCAMNCLPARTRRSGARLHSAAFHGHPRSMDRPFRSRRLRPSARVQPRAWSC